MISLAKDATPCIVEREVSYHRPTAGERSQPLTYSALLSTQQQYSASTTDEKKERGAKLTAACSTITNRASLRLFVCAQSSIIPLASELKGENNSSRAMCIRQNVMF